MSFRVACEINYEERWMVCELSSGRPLRELFVDKRSFACTQLDLKRLIGPRRKIRSSGPNNGAFLSSCLENPLLHSSAFNELPWLSGLVPGVAAMGSGCSHQLSSTLLSPGWGERELRESADWNMNQHLGILNRLCLLFVIFVSSSHLLQELPLELYFKNVFHEIKRTCLNDQQLTKFVLNFSSSCRYVSLFQSVLLTETIVIGDHSYIYQSFGMP